VTDNPYRAAAEPSERGDTVRRRSGSWPHFLALIVVTIPFALFLWWHLETAAIETNTPAASIINNTAKTVLGLSTIGWYLAAVVLILGHRICFPTRGS
jgi:hypothetical protein